MRIKDLLETDRLDDLNPVQRWMVFGEYEEMMCVDAKFFTHGECGKLEDTIHNRGVLFPSAPQASANMAYSLRRRTSRRVRQWSQRPAGRRAQLSAESCTEHTTYGVVACLDNFKLANGKVTYEIDLE